MASPDGPSHGLSEYFFVTVAFAASISTISLASSMFTYTRPLPSATENSGLPGSGMVATTLLVFASIAVALLERPLKANTRPEAASYRMESGFSPVGTVPVVFNVFKSKIVTVLPRPSLMNPRFSSGAIAIPWTPGVSGMSPTTLFESRSTTTTWVACETYKRRAVASAVR